MIEKVLRDTFIVFHLSEKEIRFMLASYKLGPAGIPSIAKAARLERSTAYLIAEQLLEKGLLIEDFKQYKKLLVAIQPKSLLRMVAARQRVLHRQELNLEEQLPELESYYGAMHLLPRVRVFQGKKALSAVWKDVLATQGEICLWTNQTTEHLFFTKELHERFIEERTRKRIPIRVLAVNNELGKKLLERDERTLRHSKLLPIHTSFNAETYLYDNKIAMLDYKSDTIGIIIEGEAMASTQRAIFDMMWKQLP